MKYLCLIYDDERKWATMAKGEAQLPSSRTRSRTIGFASLPAAILR
jgi:hypothetical protein